jgi:hypothetical protein
MSRTFNRKIGQSILDIIYQYEPLGIGYCEIQRKGNFYDNTLTYWLKHLEAINFIYRTKRFIRLTIEAKEKYENGTLVIPHDSNSKNKLTDKDRKIILLILSIGAFGYFKWNKVYHQSDTNSKVESLTNKDFMYYGGKRIPGVAIEDIVFYHENEDGLLKLRTNLLEDQINVTNMGLFGHLELIESKAEKYIKYLTDYDIPILLETKYHNQTRYIIKDEELKKFIKICVILFCQDVYPILEYLYSLNESILKARKETELKYFDKSSRSYPNISKDERIDQLNKNIKSLKNSLLYRYRLRKYPTFDNRGQQPDQIETFQRWMKEIWFGKDRSKDYFKNMKSGLLVDDADNVRRSVKDIYKCNIFDDNLNSINDKYKILQEKYPEVVEAILDTLFPRFFRDIIREEYKKNVTIKK